MAFDREYEAPSGLEPLLRALVTVTHERHADMIDLVSGLPPEALTWAPAPEAAHLSGLVAHVLDVEEHVARVAAGEEVEWEGALGSRMETEWTEAELVAAIERVDGTMKRAFEGLTEELALRNEPGQERRVGEMMIEEADHSAMHYGQIQLTRHLWEAAHPEWQSGYEHWR